jgi:hypothetical protein
MLACPSASVAGPRAAEVEEVTVPIHHPFPHCFTEVHLVNTSLLHLQGLHSTIALLRQRNNRPWTHNISQRWVSLPILHPGKTTPFLPCPTHSGIRGSSASSISLRRVPAWRSPTVPAFLHLGQTKAKAVLLSRPAQPLHHKKTAATGRYSSQ